MEAQKKRERNTTIAIVSIAALVVAGLAIWGVSYKVADNNKKEQLAAAQEELRQYNRDWAACAYPEDTQKPEPVSEEEIAGLDETMKKQAEDYNKSIEEMAGKEKSGTPPEGDQYSHGTAEVTLTTNKGDIPITLDRAKAPCNVASFVGLVEQKYFDDTICHRLTVTPKEQEAMGQGLNVLQCGDPTGTGMGGPGYMVKDEPPTDLTPSADGQSVVYPRGTIAMAKSQQPDSAGSQFFLVYKDSTLPPQYSVMGQISEDGMEVLDKLVADGTKSDDQDSPDAQKPKKEISITSARLGKVDDVPERPAKPDVELPEGEIQDPAADGLPGGGMPMGDTAGIPMGGAGG